MILWFATKRNVNGHRKYLGIGTKRQEYTRNENQWLIRPDFTEISATDMKRMEQKLIDNGFSKVDYIASA